MSPSAILNSTTDLSHDPVLLFSHAQGLLAAELVGLPQDPPDMGLTATGWLKVKF